MEALATIVHTFDDRHVSRKVLLTHSMALGQCKCSREAHAKMCAWDAKALGRWLRTTLPSKTLALLYKDLCNDPPLSVVMEAELVQEVDE